MKRAACRAQEARGYTGIVSYVVCKRNCRAKRPQSPHGRMVCKSQDPREGAAGQQVASSTQGKVRRVSPWAAWGRREEPMQVGRAV